MMSVSSHEQLASLHFSDFFSLLSVIPCGCRVRCTPRQEDGEKRGMMKLAGALCCGRMSADIYKQRFVRGHKNHYHRGAGRRLD